MISQIELKEKLSELLLYAKDKLSLDKDDVFYTQNALLDLFKLDSPINVSSYPKDIQHDVIDKIVEYAYQEKMILDNEKILFETKLMGLLLKAPSAIIRDFNEIKNKNGINAATDWFFEISKCSNYIRLEDINKNIKWSHNGKIGNIDITINLSKPEKDPKQIALEKSRPKSGYPACMLCLENVGFAGHISHPARQTLRVIPIKLNNEEWSMQYSPYQYFREHLIALSNEHRPMNVTNETLKRLLDFVDIFPHYFLGSNASLPIVGGSILSHDHYQGGAKVLPMFNAKTRTKFLDCEHKDVDIYILDWYNSVVHLESKNKESIFDVAKTVLNNWREYSDESVSILSNTNNEPHNAITPIVRKNNDVYNVDLILRNNRTDEKFPDGIFHAAPHLHNIKKEGIGLIEVMGLFILPGRLKKEFELLSEYLMGKKKFNDSDFDDSSPLTKHKNMLLSLIDKYGTNLSYDNADKAIKNYVNQACEEILECTAVFKNTDIGQKAFIKFMIDKMNYKIN